MKLTTVAAVCVLFSSIAHAEEGFKIRYPTGGLLGPEMAYFDIKPGLLVSVAIRETDVTQINGDDGRQAWTPPTTNAKGVTQTALADYRQHLTVVDMGIGYIFPQMVGAGHVFVAANLPYFLQIDRTLSFPEVTATGANGTPVTPGPAYLAGLNAQAKANTIASSGVGDTELNATWIYLRDNLKLSAGLTIVIPTGDFYSLPSGAQGTPAINIGFGHYNTFRPTITLTYKATDDLTLGARAAYGINTTNTVDNWKSGNFEALDLAASYKTPVGAFGTQVISVKQIQDDTGGLSGNQPGGYGANRYNAVNAGVFYTTRVLGCGLNLGYTKTMHATNALVADTIQARLTKAF